MDFAEKLRSILKDLPLLDVEVRLMEGDEYHDRYLATVTSPGFASLTDAERQAMVWGQVLERLDETEQRRVEFVWTETPEEALATPD